MGQIVAFSVSSHLVYQKSWKFTLDLNFQNNLYSPGTEESLAVDVIISKIRDLYTHFLSTKSRWACTFWEHHKTLSKQLLQSRFSFLKNNATFRKSMVKNSAWVDYKYVLNIKFFSKNFFLMLIFDFISNVIPDYRDT